MPGNTNVSYTFTLQSDDGAMLFIDGVLLINNTGTGPALFIARPLVNITSLPMPVSQT